MYTEVTNMVGMNGVGIGNAYGVYKKNTASKDLNTSNAKETNATEKLEDSKASDYGKTIGEPKLSDDAKKYYDTLKKKFGNYDFILVSKDEKENAKANAAKYANGFKTVVLIDEEKIEKMAADKDFRKKYEDILSGAASQMQQLKETMQKSGASVKGYGMQINDNGTASYFAVLKKSSAEQKARIEKKASEKKAEKKAADKKADLKRAEKKAAEKLKEKKAEKAEKSEKISNQEDEEIISADSIEELMRKVEAHTFEERSNSVMTDAEKMVGQSIDFRG